MTKLYCPFRLPNLYNVMDYGCHADGVTDDVAHIESAITAASGGIVFFPAGTYLLSSDLAVPAGTNLRGADLSTTHLKGRVRFNSNSTFQDMKIGNTAMALFNDCYAYNNYPDNVQFLRCQFRGGPAASNTDVVLLYQHLTNVTFTDCNFECHQGTYTGTEHYDNVMIQPATVAPSIHDINFVNCNFGVTNGVATGAPRMHVEICPDFWNETRTTCYHDINFNGCTFEPGGGWGQSIDYCGCSASSDDFTSIAGNSHVLDCLFKGNLVANSAQIDIESLIENIEIGRNTFRTGVGGAVSFGNNTDDMGEGDDPDYPSYHYGHDNIIDYSYDNGLTCAASNIVRITGKGNRFEDNILLNKFGAVWPAAGMYVALYVQNNAPDNIVEGNTITQSPAASYAVRLGTGSTGNFVRYNTFTGGGIDDQGSGNTITPNP